MPSCPSWWWWWWRNPLWLSSLYFWCDVVVVVDVLLFKTCNDLHENGWWPRPSCKTSFYVSWLVWEKNTSISFFEICWFLFFFDLLTFGWIGKQHHRTKAMKATIVPINSMKSSIVCEIKQNKNECVIYFFLYFTGSSPNKNMPNGVISLTIGVIMPKKKEFMMWFHWFTHKNLHKRIDYI